LLLFPILFDLLSYHCKFLDLHITLQALFSVVRKFSFRHVVLVDDGFVAKIDSAFFWSRTQLTPLAKRLLLVCAPRIFCLNGPRDMLASSLFGNQRSWNSLLAWRKKVHTDGSIPVCRTALASLCVPFGQLVRYLFGESLHLA